MDDVRITGGWDAEGNRRVKVLYLDQTTVLDAVASFLRDDPRYPRYRIVLRTPVLELTGVTVIAATTDFVRRAFGFLIHHPSFDPVPEGCPAPNYMGECEWVWDYVDTRPDEPEPVTVGG